MNPTLLRWIFAICISSAATVAFWLSNQADAPDFLEQTMFWVGLPAILLGFAATGNVHQPSALVGYTSFFLIWLGLGYAISKLLWRSTPRAE